MKHAEAPIPTPRGGLFDFDGTLAPNLDLMDMRRQLVVMAEQTDIPRAVYQDLYFVEMIEAGSRWLGVHRSERQAQDYAQASQQRIIDIELAAAAETTLFPFVRTLLSRLNGESIRLGIVTRNCRAAIHRMFPDHEDYVQALHARDDVAHLKPDPRHLEVNLQALDVDPKEAVMVGDGILDMQAGLALQMHCVGVLSGSNDTEALVAAGAHKVLPDASQLADLF